SNFVNGSVVRWNGQDRQTMFVSATQLSAQITTADLQTAVIAPITVFNPTPGGGTSNAVNFTVSPAQVTVTTQTNPAGLLVSIDGGPPQTAPQVRTWDAGSQHTIATTSPQGDTQTQYLFTGWSD